MEETTMVNVILKAVGAQTPQEFIRSYADRHFNFGFDSFLANTDHLEFPPAAIKTFSFPNGYSVEVLCLYESKGYCEYGYTVTLLKDNKAVFNDDFYDVIEMADTEYVKELLQIAKSY